MNINALCYRELGLCGPQELEVIQATQRSFTVDTCKLRDFANCHNGGVNALELEKIEGRYLLTGGGKGNVIIYDTWNTSGIPKHQYQPVSVASSKHKHKFSVETVQWYPFDNGLFTTSSSDKELKIWDSNLLTPAETYEFNGIVYSHHMSTCATEHNLIAVGTSSSQVKMIDMRTGSSIQILKGHNKSVYCVRWSPCLPFILTTGGNDGRIFFWDIRMAKGQMLSLDQFNGKKSNGTAHTGEVLGLEFTDTGYHLLSYGMDDIVRLWDTFTGHNELVNYGKIFNDVARCLKFTMSCGTYNPVLYMPEGELIRCLDVYTGQLIKTLSGHFRQVNCCHYNPYTHDVYSGSNDRNLLVWTADFVAEEKYLERLELQEKNTQSNHNKPSQPAQNVLADTWSDDESE